MELDFFSNKKKKETDDNVVNNVMGEKIYLISLLS